MRLTEASVPRVGGLKRWGHGDFGDLCFFSPKKLDSWFATIGNFSVRIHRFCWAILEGFLMVPGTGKRSTLKCLSPQTLAVNCQAWVVASSAQVKSVAQSHTNFYKERNKYLAGKRRIDASLRGPECVNRNFYILFVISLQSKNAETSLSLWSHHNSGHLVVWAADASPEASWKWVLGRQNVKRTLPWLISCHQLHLIQNLSAMICHTKWVTPSSPHPSSCQTFKRGSIHRNIKSTHLTTSPWISLNSDASALL